MDDIVTRMHALAERFGKCSDQKTCAEAAAEIERLRAENARLRDALIRIETLADEMMFGRSSYVGAIRDTARAARAALAEKEGA